MTAASAKLMFLHAHFSVLAQAVFVFMKLNNTEQQYSGFFLIWRSGKGDEREN